MNDNNLKKYFERLRGVSLSEKSRTRIREALEQYADFHTIPEGVRATDVSRSIERVPTRTLIISQLSKIKITHMTAAILIALLVGGGTSYAAQDALPGDFLYPVKVEVNENVQSVFAVSNEAEAELQARLVEERLREAETLATRGSLDAERAAELDARVAAHTEAVNRHADQAEEKGNFEVSATVRAELEGTFDAYADILSRIEGRVVGNSTTTLISNIRARAAAAQDLRISVDAHTDINVRSVVARSEALVLMVERRLARAESEISVEAHARIETRFGEALRAQSLAEASLQSEDYREAYREALHAVRIAKEVEAMIHTALRIEIDVDVFDDDGRVEDSSDSQEKARDSQDDHDRSNEEQHSDEGDADDGDETDADRSGIESDTSVKVRLEL